MPAQDGLELTATATVLDGSHTRLWAHVCNRGAARDVLGPVCGNSPWRSYVALANGTPVPQPKFFTCAALNWHKFDHGADDRFEVVWQRRGWNETADAWQPLDAASFVWHIGFRLYNSNGSIAAQMPFQLAT